MSQTEQALILALRTSHMRGDYAREELDFFIPKWRDDGEYLSLTAPHELARFGKWFTGSPCQHQTLEVEATASALDQWVDLKLCGPDYRFRVYRYSMKLKNDVWSEHLYMPRPTRRRLVVDFCRILNTWLDATPSLKETTRNTLRTTIATFQSKVEILLAH